MDNCLGVLRFFIDFPVIIRYFGLVQKPNISILIAFKRTIDTAFKILTGKPIEKRPLGRPRRRWENNIRMALEEIGINAGIWVDSAQDRDYKRALVNAALNFLIP